MDQPSLIEPGVYAGIQLALQQSHLYRMQWYNRCLNMASFLGLCCLLGLFLWSRYKGHATPEEQEQRELDKQRNILEAYKHLQQAKERVDAERNDPQGSITGLPAWQSEYDIVRYH